MSTLLPRPAIAPSAGFTLPELIVVIAVLSIAVAGVMLAFSQAVRGSADPLVVKQAHSIAEAMLEEIQLTSFAALPNAGSSRIDFNNVQDYDGYNSGAGIVDIEGNSIPGLAGYQVQVDVVAADFVTGLGGTFEVPSANVWVITVTVTGPGGVTAVESGYRFSYP